MKKSLVVVVILIGGIGTLAAQSVDVMGGLNLATITGEPGHSIRKGYYLGVGKSMSLSKFISFRPEIYYSLQGAEGQRNTRVTFHYMQMPLYFDFAFGSAGVALGPQIAILAGAKYKDVSGETFPILPITNKSDVLVGGGPYYRITNQLKVDVRVAFGITSFDTYDEGLHNRIIQAGVSWSINKSATE